MIREMYYITQTGNVTAVFYTLIDPFKIVITFFK